MIMKYEQLKSYLWNTPVPWEEARRIRSEHPNGDNLSHPEVQFIYNVQYLEKEFERIYKKKYTGSVWGPAVYDKDGNIIPSKHPYDGKYEKKTDMTEDKKE